MSFLPRDEKFFELLEQQGAIASEAARILAQAVRDGDERTEAAGSTIQALETQGDRILMHVFERLNATFITPIDPEDIAALANRLDDILDAIEEAAHRVSSYRLRPIPQAVISLCDLIDGSVVEVCKALRALSKKQSVIPYWTKIEQFEDEADTISRQAVHDLFEAESDPIRVMKAKEIIELLEEVTDCCQHTADTIKTVFVKNG